MNETIQVVGCQRGDAENGGLNEAAVKGRRDALARMWPPAASFPHHCEGDKVPPVFTDLLHLCCATSVDKEAMEAFPNDFVLLPGDAPSSRVEQMVELALRMPSTWRVKTRRAWFPRRWGYEVAMLPEGSGPHFTSWMDIPSPTWTEMYTPCLLARWVDWLCSVAFRRPRRWASKRKRVSSDILDVLYH